MILITRWWKNRWCCFMKCLCTPLWNVLLLLICLHSMLFMFKRQLFRYFSGFFCHTFHERKKYFWDKLSSAERSLKASFSLSLILTLSVMAVPCCGRLEDCKELCAAQQCPVHCLVPALTVSIWPHKRIPSCHSGNIRPTMKGQTTFWGKRVNYVTHYTANDPHFYLWPGS